MFECHEAHRSKVTKRKHLCECVYRLGWTHDVITCSVSSNRASWINFTICSFTVLCKTLWHYQTPSLLYYRISCVRWSISESWDSVLDIHSESIHVYTLVKTRRVYRYWYSSPWNLGTLTSEIIFKQKLIFKEEPNFQFSLIYNSIFFENEEVNSSFPDTDSSFLSSFPSFPLRLQDHTQVSWTRWCTHVVSR